MKSVVAVKRSKWERDLLRYGSEEKVKELYQIQNNAYEKIYSAREAVKRLNTVAPKIETMIIPGAGHDLTLVQAELVNQAILEFFDRP